MSVASCGCDATFAGMAACHCGRCMLPSPTDRPATPTDGWHGPACPQSCWAWSCSAIAVGAGQPATPRNPGLRWGDRLLSVGPPHRTHAIGARSTIDEVRDRARIMGGLPKIGTPGAQTGRCARRRATITACPVGWDSPANAIAARLRRSIAISAARAAWSRSRQDAFERLVGSQPELPPLHQTATPCDQRAELTAFRTGCC